MFLSIPDDCCMYCVGPTDASASLQWLAATSALTERRGQRLRGTFQRIDQDTVSMLTSMDMCKLRDLCRLSTPVFAACQFAATIVTRTGSPRQSTAPDDSSRTFKQQRSPSHQPDGVNMQATNAPTHLASGGCCACGNTTQQCHRGIIVPLCPRTEAPSA